MDFSRPTSGLSQPHPSVALVHGTGLGQAKVTQSKLPPCRWGEGEILHQPFPFQAALVLIPNSELHGTCS